MKNCGGSLGIGQKERILRSMFDLLHRISIGSPDSFIFLQHFPEMLFPQMDFLTIQCRSSLSSHIGRKCKMKKLVFHICFPVAATMATEFQHDRWNNHFFSLSCYFVQLIHQLYLTFIQRKNGKVQI